MIGYAVHADDASFEGDVGYDIELCLRHFCKVSCNSYLFQTYKYPGTFILIYRSFTDAYSSYSHKCVSADLVSIQETFRTKIALRRLDYYDISKSQW